MALLGADVKSALQHAGGAMLALGGQAAAGSGSGHTHGGTQS